MLDLTENFVHADPMNEIKEQEDEEENIDPFLHSKKHPKIEVTRPPIPSDPAFPEIDMRQ